MGVTAVAALDPAWNYQVGKVELIRRDHMIHCLISGMKKCVMMPVNYKKVKNAMQEKEKNSALF